MENQTNPSSIQALQDAYLRVINQRKANASMLQWSLSIAERWITRARATEQSAWFLGLQGSQHGRTYPLEVSIASYKPEYDDRAAGTQFTTNDQWSAHLSS